jgi:hypothetical protein
MRCVVSSCGAWAAPLRFPDVDKVHQLFEMRIRLVSDMPLLVPLLQCQRPKWPLLKPPGLCREFVARASRLLEQGGAKVTKLESLIGQAEQFAWGPADVTAGITEIHERLKDAKQWVAQVFCQGRHCLCFRSLSTIARVLMRYILAQDGSGSNDRRRISGALAEYSRQVCSRNAQSFLTAVECQRR